MMDATECGNVPLLWTAANELEERRGEEGRGGENAKTEERDH